MMKKKNEKKLKHFWVLQLFSVLVNKINHICILDNWTIGIIIYNDFIFAVSLYC